MYPGQPAIPDPPGRRGDEPPPQIGDFRQGSPASRLALGSYLVGRAIGDYLRRELAVLALLVLALAVVVWLVGPHWVAVLIGVLALTVLVLRAALGAILRRLTGGAFFAPIESRLRGLVADTRGDVRGELRRVGLPSHPVTMPLLVLRFLRRARREDALRRIRQFDVDRVVPAARLDELYLLVKSLQPGVPPGPQAY